MEKLGRRDDWYHGLHANNESQTLEDLDLYGTLKEKFVRLTPRQVILMLEEAFSKTKNALWDLNEEELLTKMGPSHNPLHWSIGHLAFFYETGALQLLDQNQPSILEVDCDLLFDSFRVSHDERWDPKNTCGVEYDSEFCKNYLRKVIQKLKLFVQKTSTTTSSSSSFLSPAATYILNYSIIHNNWHNEDFIQTRQTLGYTQPKYEVNFQITDTFGGINYDMKKPIIKNGPWPGRVYIPGGTYMLGAKKTDKWYFDQEKWAHPVHTKPFWMAKSQVTNIDFLQFVKQGGYERKEFWSYEGWKRQCKAKKTMPLYWKKEKEIWYIRFFNIWRSMHEVKFHPVCHISFDEAEAFAKFKGARLPTEVEWEIAASCTPSPCGTTYIQDDRLYPWGNEQITVKNCNCGYVVQDFVDVCNFPESDSPFGCRQMLGNSYEWTCTTFLPFPGYVIDFPYRENSAPWFGNRKVVKGVSYVTPNIIGRIKYRCYWMHEQNVVFTGFRLAYDIPKSKL